MLSVMLIVYLSKPVSRKSQYCLNHSPQMRLHAHCALWQVSKGHGLLHVAALGHLQLHGVDVVRGLAVVAGDVAVLEATLEQGGGVWRCGGEGDMLRSRRGEGARFNLQLMVARRCQN